MCEELSKLTDIQSSLTFISKNGSFLKQSKLDSNNLLFQVISKIIPRFINELLVKNNLSDFIIKSGTGHCGQWATVPYICLLDKKLSSNGRTYTPSRGIYPAFLISPDCQSFYLSYMISVGSKNEREMKNIVSAIRENIHTDYSFDVESMNLGKKINQYRLAVVCYTEYNSINLPSDDIVEKDLLNIIQIHKENGRRYENILASMWSIT